MSHILQLTAYKVGPSADALSTPRMVTLSDQELTEDYEVIQKTASGHYGSVIKSRRGSKKFEVFETGLQIDTQINPSKAGNDVDSSVSAAGTAQGTATDLTKYMNVVDAATAASAEGVQLDAATEGKVRRIINATAVEIDVYPATGEVINALAANAAFQIAAGKTYHFACLEDGTWLSVEVN